MHDKTPIFYPNEVVTGKVVEMNGRYAVLDVYGFKLPLETRFIDWNALKNPAERLTIGDRIEAVVNDNRIGEIDYHENPKGSKIRWQDYWLSCLPLLEDFLPKLGAKYPSGSIMEVEFLGYNNFYTARVKTPEGFIIELLVNMLHPNNINLGFEENLRDGETIKLLIRKLHRRGLWVQRHKSKSAKMYLAESGYCRSYKLLTINDYALDL